MRILVLGSNGYIGRHVARAVCSAGHELLTSGDELEPTDAAIHLGWRGLPNYESTAHYDNVHRVVLDLRALRYAKVRNVTVAGTCLEAVQHAPHYARAKMIVHKEAETFMEALKWVRLFYVYGGEGERPERLYPSLMRAVKDEMPSFRVIDGARDFMHVERVAENLVRIATQNEVVGTIDCCTGIATPVATFCRQQLRGAPMELRTDYPAPAYEPRIMFGNPTKLHSIK